MAARLKVFVWSDGLTDYAVAASSRPKALAAWDSDIDLFKTGLAHQTDDAALVAAATASPGVVITRPVSGGPAKALKAARPVARKAPTAKEKAITALKAALADLAAAQAGEVAALEAKQAALKAEVETMTARHDEAREALEARLKAAL